MKTFLTLTFVCICMAGTAIADVDLSQMLKDAEMVPHIENGKQVGLRMVEVKKGSQWERMGIKQNDIIKSAPVEQAPTREPKFERLDGEDDFEDDISDELEE